jgi:hypothetical protein
MAIEFVQLNDATTTGARIAGDVVTGATPSDNVFFQTVQLVKGATGAAKTAITSGAGLPVIIDALATITVGAGTATIGSVNLTSPTGNSLTTDGVLLVQGGSSTATIGFTQISETTATYVLGGGTATIGTVLLNTATGGSLTTDGALIVIPQSTATTVLGAGTATVGFVTLASGTATGGTVHTVLSGYRIGTATGGSLTPLYASISFVASDANSTATIVAGVAGARIRPISYVLVAQGPLNVQWTTATTGTLSGFMALASQTGIAANYNPYGHMETIAGELLGIRGSATGITVAGHICYVEAVVT